MMRSNIIARPAARIRAAYTETMSALFRRDGSLLIGCKAPGAPDGDPLLLASPPDWPVSVMGAFKKFANMYAMSADQREAYLGIGNWATAAIVNLHDYSVTTIFKLHDTVRSGSNPSLVLGIVLCDDGTAVTCGTDLKLRKWRIADAQQVAEVEWKPLSGSRVPELMYFKASRDRRWIITEKPVANRIVLQVWATGTLDLRSEWEMEQQEIPAMPPGMGFAVQTARNIAFHPSNDEVFVAEKHVSVFDLDGRLRRTVVTEEPVWYGDCGLSPDGNAAAISVKSSGSSTDWDVALFDLRDGRQLTRLKRAGANGIRSVTFSPDGRWLAVCGIGRVDIWDVGHLMARSAPLLPTSSADAPTGLEPALPAKKKSPRKKKSG